MIDSTPIFAINKLRNIRFDQLIPGTILAIIDTKDKVCELKVLISVEQISFDDAIRELFMLNNLNKHKCYLRMIWLDGYGKINMSTISPDSTLEWWNLLIESNGKSISA